MAYSRWSNSVWYTYWSSNKSYEFKLPTEKNKNEQIFYIGDSPCYILTYGRIKKDGIDAILKDIKEHYSRDTKDTVIVEGKNGLPRYKSVARKAKHPTDEQIEELKSYINEFIVDVDDHFKWKNFFTYEWYYALKNKICNLTKN